MTRPERERSNKQTREFNRYLIYTQIPFAIKSMESKDITVKNCEWLFEILFFFFLEFIVKTFRRQITAWMGGVRP